MNTTYAPISESESSWINRKLQAKSFLNFCQQFTTLYQAIKCSNVNDVDISTSTVTIRICRNGFFYLCSNVLFYLQSWFVFVKAPARGKIQAGRIGLTFRISSSICSRSSSKNQGSRTNVSWLASKAEVSSDLEPRSLYARSSGSLIG